MKPINLNLNLLFDEIKIFVKLFSAHLLLIVGDQVLLDWHIAHGLHYALTLFNVYLVRGYDESLFFYNLKYLGHHLTIRNPYDIVLLIQLVSHDIGLQEYVWVQKRFNLENLLWAEILLVLTDSMW